MQLSLEEAGKIRSERLESLYVPLEGLLLALWLDGHIPQVVLYLKGAAKIRFGPRARVESVRMVIGGFNQTRAFPLDGTLWEVFLTEGSGKEIYFKEDAEGAPLINGFTLRVVLPKRK